MTFVFLTVCFRIWSTLLNICLFSPPLMSAPVAADPANSSLRGLQRGRVHRADDPLATHCLPRTQRKFPHYNLNGSFFLRWVSTAVPGLQCYVTYVLLQLIGKRLPSIVNVLLHGCKQLHHSCKFSCESFFLIVLFCGSSLSRRDDGPSAIFNFLSVICHALQSWLWLPWNRLVTPPKRQLKERTRGQHRLMF